jgi:hypothetical protein
MLTYKTSVIVKATPLRTPRPSRVPLLRSMKIPLFVCLWIMLREVILLIVMRYIEIFTIPAVSFLNVESEDVTERTLDRLELWLPRSHWSAIRGCHWTLVSRAKVRYPITKSANRYHTSLQKMSTFCWPAMLCRPFFPSFFNMRSIWHAGRFPIDQFCPRVRFSMEIPNLAILSITWSSPPACVNCFFCARSFISRSWWHSRWQRLDLSDQFVCSIAIIAFRYFMTLS